MEIIRICVLISGLSFFAYSLNYMLSARMKNELKRLQMEHLSHVIVICQFLGATGLFLGLFYNWILVLSSFGLAMLMLCGLIVRAKSKDNLFVSLPALFYLVLNLYYLFPLFRSKKSEPIGSLFNNSIRSILHVRIKILFFAHGINPLR